MTSNTFTPPTSTTASDLNHHHKRNSDPSFLIGFNEDRNRMHRRSMEDAHTYKLNFGNVHGQGYFAIYDGHAGRQAALWCGEHLHDLFLEKMKQCPNTSIPEIFNLTYLETDLNLDRLKIHSGCTAVSSFIRYEGDRRVLYSANVGDARSVLCRKGQAIRLSYDHKGTDPFEAKRIVDAGGFILNHRVNGVLAVTRSLGDLSMKELVVGNPYTTEIDITPDDDFLILACDGVWDVMSDQEAVNLILGFQDPQLAAEKLVRQALENLSTDNLSVLVIRFVHSTTTQNHAFSVPNSESLEIVFDDDKTPTPRSVSLMQVDSPSNNHLTPSASAHVL